MKLDRDKLVMRAKRTCFVLSFRISWLNSIKALERQRSCTWDRPFANYINPHRFNNGRRLLPQRTLYHHLSYQHSFCQRPLIFYLYGFTASWVFCSWNGDSVRHFDAKIKVNVKFTLKEVMTTQRMSRGIALLFF